MDQSNNVKILGKKLFDEFNLLLSNHDINEISIIQSHTNKELVGSPFHIHNGCFGLEKWCIKYLFCYAYNTMLKLKEQAQMTEEINLMSRCVAILCPDCSIAWSIRKQFQIDSVGLLCSNKELLVIELAVRIQPKSTEAFAHRKWVFNHLFKSMSQALVRPHLPQNVLKSCICGRYSCTVAKVNYCENVLNLLQEELFFCSKVSNWHKCNYSAWAYRVLIVRNFIIPTLFACSNNLAEIQKTSSLIYQELLHLLITDFHKVADWMELHVSDYSSMSYLEFLLHNFVMIVSKHHFCFSLKQSSKSPLCTAIPDLFTLWNTAFQHNSNLILLHDGHHEALWLHRRGLLLLFSKHLNYFSEIKDINFNESFSLQKEKEFCDNLCTRTNDVSVIKCVNNYKNYLKKYIFV